MSRGSYTGGSGDILPQVMTVYTDAAGAADDYVNAIINLPTNRIVAGRRKVSVIELLQVDWYLGIEDLGDTASHTIGYLATYQRRANAATCSLTTIREDFRDPRVFAPAIISRFLTTSGATSVIQPVSINLTDNNGNGVMVGTDQLIITHGNVNGTAGASAIARIKYRFVDVGVTEFLGLQQSQIGPASAV